MFLKSYDFSTEIHVLYLIGVSAENDLCIAGLVGTLFLFSGTCSGSGSSFEICLRCDFKLMLKCRVFIGYREPDLIGYLIVIDIKLKSFLNAMQQASSITRINPPTTLPKIIGVLSSGGSLLRSVFKLKAKVNDAI